MESQALINKYKNKLLNAVIMVIALIIISNIFKGQSQQVKVLNETRAAELKKNEILSSINSLEKKISAYKKTFGKKDPSAVINSLSTIARESNAKIIAITPKGQDNRSAYTKYPFDLVVGVENFHVLGKFVSNIENSNDLFFIDRMGIRPTEKIPTQEQKYGLTVNLSISTVSYR